MRIADFRDKLSGFADLKNTLDRRSAENFGPDSGLCMSRSSDCGSDNYFRSPALVEILLNHIPLDRYAKFTNWSGTQ